MLWVTSVVVMANLEETNADLTEGEGLTLHLIGVTQSEAIASLNNWGEPKVCAYDDCSAKPTMLFVFKKAGSAWGRNVRVVASCKEHELRIFTPRRKPT